MTPCSRRASGRLGIHRRSIGNDRPRLDTNGRIAEEDRDRARVERRRHDEDAELRPEALAGVERECQAEIRLEVALVELVEDDERDAVERGISLEASGEDAVGDDLDPGRLRDPAFVTRRDADGLPDTLAEQCRHPCGGSTGRDPTRFEQEHATAIHPRLAQQAEGNDRRLACARFSLEDRSADPGERDAEFVDDLFDRKAGRRRAGGRWPRARVRQLHGFHCHECDISSDLRPDAAEIVRLPDQSHSDGKLEADSGPIRRWKFGWRTASCQRRASSGLRATGSAHR